MRDVRISVGGAPTVGAVSTASYLEDVSSFELSDDTANPGGGESIVQQQYLDETDVNVIVRRFGISQLAAQNAMGVYGDFTGIYDYESAVARIEGAQERFMRLPAEVRDRFRNDPGLLIRAANELSPEDFAKLMDPPKAVVVDPTPAT